MLLDRVMLRMEMMSLPPRMSINFPPILNGNGHDQEIAERIKLDSIPENSNNCNC